jgi:putative hemolysin
MEIRIQQFKTPQSSASVNDAEIDGQTKLERIPAIEIVDGRYVMRFARTLTEIDAALRLRFEVFNLELREGLESSYITGRDEDRFDAVCHHLLVLEQETGAVVGTYRLQTLEMAQSVAGFYCSDEFQLEQLPLEVLSQSLEIGRACIALEHRNSRVLFLLWKGLAEYAVAHCKRYLFGCCSLTSQDAAEGQKARRRIEQGGFYHQDFFVAPRSEYVCESESVSVAEVDNNWELPKLFLTYMRFGAKVCSPPAIDREFKTIDFFVMFDLETIAEKYRRMFLE